MAIEVTADGSNMMWQSEPGAFLFLAQEDLQALTTPTDEATVLPSSAAAAPQVIIDGQNENITGSVRCTTNGSNINIGIGDATNGVGAVVSNANPPIVHAVGLGAVNGVTLGFSDAYPDRLNAQATTNGNSYKITGTATGVDVSNPQQPEQVIKSFEMDVTCP